MAIIKYKDISGNWQEIGTNSTFYTYSYSSTIHSLVGSGIVGIAKFTTPYITGHSITINEITVDAIYTGNKIATSIPSGIYFQFIYIENKMYIGELEGILPAGGTAGQILTKNSSISYDAVWKNDNNVKYTGQSGKSEAEKAQARTNIGAAAVTNVISAFGEIGYSTYTTVYGQVTAIKQPNGKYTISICAVPTAITRATDVYYFISTSKIVALLGLTGTMTIANDKGTRTLTTAPVTSSQIQYGLVAEVNSNLQAIGYGRIYTTSGNVGSWPLSDTVAYTVNAQYLIWLYDITIA